MANNIKEALPRTGRKPGRFPFQPEVLRPNMAMDVNKDGKFDITDIVQLTEKRNSFWDMVFDEREAYAWRGNLHNISDTMDEILSGNTITGSSEAHGAIDNKISQNKLNLKSLQELIQPVSTVSEGDNAHTAIDMKIIENDLYQLAKLNQLSKSTYFPSEIKQSQEVKGGLGALESIMPPISIKSIADIVKLAKKFKGLSNIPAYLRSPWAKTKGLRKTGITEGKATQDDPLFKALEYFDSKGEKIPLSRRLDFLLKKEK